MPVELSLASEGPTEEEQDFEFGPSPRPHQLVSPGDVITRDTGYMRGHGTYMKQAASSNSGSSNADSGGILYATVAGVVERVNKLITVTPPKTKYQGEIGDVVVGRITEVQQKRWKVEVNSRLDAVLQLSSVNLPGGELRRRTAEDELTMRKYLVEGDLISAEVQNLYSDGAVALHTRSLKYGKLSQGTLVTVSPSLIKRRKTHFHQLPCGASVILGNNGYVWIYPTTSSDEEGEGGGFSQNMGVVPRQDREVIARLRGCVLALANNGVMLWDTTLSYAYEAAAKHTNTDLLKTDVMFEIAKSTRYQLRLEAMDTDQ